MSEILRMNGEESASVEAFYKGLPLDGTLTPLGKKVGGKDLSLMARHVYIL